MLKEGVVKQKSSLSLNPYRIKERGIVLGLINTK